MRRRLAAAVLLAAGLGASAAPAGAAAADLPDATVKARQHVFGLANVAADGSLPRGKVLLSWITVSTFAAALDGHVVLLDGYVHKVEDRPNYVPTTAREVEALRPEAVFIGHGHFDHAKYAGRIAARTGAVVVGTPEHCAGARAEAGAAADRVRCAATVPEGAPVGARAHRIDVLGDGVEVSALKHVHSAAEAPDGEQHESVLGHGPLPDLPSLLLHPPGPSVLPGLDPSGDEGGTMLYRFRIGAFSLVWHDSSGPLRERGAKVVEALKAMPPTDVQVGAVLGFGELTNGVRDPVDYLVALRPKVFVPNHHDFITEYGTGRAFEPAVKAELAKRGPSSTEFRWLADPRDYLKTERLTFDLASDRWLDASDAPRLQLTRRCAGGRLRVELRGDVDAVRDVRFTLGRRQVARDTAAPFRQTIARPALSRSASRRLRAVVDLREGRGERTVPARSRPRC
ncbi:MBL fold metallo-hydrolase [Conexibacter sp. SYSU D00693]|uniref:MBL fold metallo-hydrolase n=1 Tax=Conexibacter sp. SYSU D00693 TaxID=2812560 RepID=UPI00196AA3E8|nr:hypothetical protein [Conexibacter sp. SYSU D00693]